MNIALFKQNCVTLNLFHLAVTAFQGLTVAPSKIKMLKQVQHDEAGGAE